MNMIATRRPLMLMVLVAAVVVLAGCSRAGAEPALPSNAGIQNWYQNGGGGRYVVPIISGRASAVNRPMRGEVLTDSDCTPDAQGLSHCHNIIGLQNGARIQIQNNHRITSVRESYQANSIA